MNLKRPSLICLTIDYPPMLGGVARYLSSLVQAANGEIKVLVPRCHSSSVRHRLDYGNPPHFTSEASFFWPLWPKWLPIIKLCLDAYPTPLLISHVFPVGTGAWIANLLGGPEYVVLFHGTDLARVKTRWKLWILRRICCRAKHLITNSQATADKLKHLVSRSNPVILTPGVNSFPLTNKSLARQKLNLDPDSKVIISVSRLVERKGIDILLQAFSSLQTNDVSKQWPVDSEQTNITNSYSEVQSPSPITKYQIQKTILTVIGSGPYAPALHQFAELLNVAVRWVENASDDDLALWYSAADIFCLPSREESDDVEGFGLVFLEAAAAGLPVIAGKGWGTSEAVLDGETGLLVKPDKDNVADALNRLLNDQDLCHRLGQAGKQRALRDFNWEERWKDLNRLLMSNVKCQMPNRGSLWHANFYNPIPLRAEPLCGASSGMRDLLESEKTEDIHPCVISNSSFGISVVIPCYNHAPELATTLESLTRQTLQPAQIIIVDDASKDDLQPIIQKYKANLPIHLVRQEQNRGAAAARNTGAKFADQDFIIFIDADMDLAPNCLEAMAQGLIDHPEASYAYSDFYWGRVHFKGQPFSDEALRKLNYIHTSSLIRRADALPFDENLKKFQDWDLWLRMAEQGKVGIWIPEILFKVIERKTGMSQWLPAFVYRIPWPVLGWTPKTIKRYREAEAIIKNKHQKTVTNDCKKS